MEYKFYKLVEQSYPLVHAEEFASDEEAVAKLNDFEEGLYMIYRVDIVDASLSHEKLIFNS